MTYQEIQLIQSGETDTPFRVLQTDNIEDSLFLRKKCIDINLTSPISDNAELQYFITRLKKTLTIQMGVGIAAPQVGLGRNIFLFMRMDDPNHPVTVAINPRIVDKSEETFCFEGDGCLSIPNRNGNTRRHTWIDVAYYTEKGELVNERLSGESRDGDYTGVIFQHEFDHLQGILFIDRLCE